MRRQYLILLAIGAFTLSLSFVLKRYLTLTDTADGLLKGLAIGLMILSLFGSLRQLQLKKEGRNLQD